MIAEHKKDIKNNITKHELSATALSKHVKSGHYRPASEMPSEWRFAGGPIVARDWMPAGLPTMEAITNNESTTTESPL